MILKLFLQLLFKTEHNIFLKFKFAILIITNIFIKNKIKDDYTNIKLFKNLFKIEEKIRIQSEDSEYIALKKLSNRCL